MKTWASAGSVCLTLLMGCSSDREPLDQFSRTYTSFVMPLA